MPPTRILRYFYDIQSRAGMLHEPDVAVAGYDKLQMISGVQEYDRFAGVFSFARRFVSQSRDRRSVFTQGSRYIAGTVLTDFVLDKIKSAFANGESIMPV